VGVITLVSEKSGVDSGDHLEFCDPASAAYDVNVERAESSRLGLFGP
jgi:hypothetical protein